MVFFIPPPQNNLFLFASASPPSLHSETKDKTMQLNGGRDRTEGRSVSRLQDSDPVWRLMDLDRVLRPGHAAPQSRCSHVQRPLRPLLKSRRCLLVQPGCLLKDELCPRSQLQAQQERRIKGRLFPWVLHTQEVKIIAAFYEQGKLPNVLLSKALAPADH